MKVLVIGSGGREHAICRAFEKSPKVTQLFCANGNAGIAEAATCVPVRPDDTKSLAAFAVANAIDLTFVGGETALALGIVDEFESHGLRIVGPCHDAAKLEASKSFAKDFMARHGVPTAKFTTSHSPAFAILELESGDFGGPDSPVVVKADGLAAGKGVVVARNRAEAITAINEMASVVGTAAAEKIVLEECLTGREVSLLMFVDGEDFALMPAVRDHKRISEGDTGPNTGGMGAITDESLLSAEDLQAIKDTIIRPTLHGCIREGFPYRGVLFLGLMMTARGPMLLEYNVRFGDPETQAILVRLETDLVDICEAVLNADHPFADLDIHWLPGSSACVVLAAEGYPGKPRVGDGIRGLADVAAVPNVEIFHAGTTADAEHHAVTNGGRVLGVTATGDDLATALAAAYAAVGKISFDGMQYRRDIGK
jgi:phosphoribosylamine--glycine ligase